MLACLPTEKNNPEIKERMIEDPPLMTIRRNFTVPPPIRWMLSRVPAASWLMPCRRGALDYRIADQQRPRFAGSLTCDNGPAVTWLHSAIEVAVPGDVILSAADGFTETAEWRPCWAWRETKV